jgi:uncharacterized protein YndB with AHSA1/START domain
LKSLETFRHRNIFAASDKCQPAIDKSKETSVTANRHGSAVIELPNDLDVLITRQFDAPLRLVFDALTDPEHVSRWFAPPGCEMKECSIDLRVGGTYHQVFVTDDGAECSFRGTYLEVEPPSRTVETWVFEGRPHLEAVETVELQESGGVTTLTMTLTFRDKASRDEDIQGGFDGMQDSLDQLEDHLGALLADGAVAE